MAGQPIVAFVSLVLTAGAIVLQFFIVLSGGINGTPENLVYFLQAPTRGISGDGFRGYDNVAWTYYTLCAIDNGKTHSCRKAHPAFPFDPQQNFGLSSDAARNQIPRTFIDTNYYYYMSRFSWAFYLIALVFAVLALFTGLVALCSRIGGWISGGLTSVAVFFQALAAALMTAWTVKGRDAFNSFEGSNSNQRAQLGKYAYGFTWGAFAALFIAMILFCVSGTFGKKKDASYESKGFFNRKRSTRSRDGVKSEYS